MRTVTFAVWAAIAAGVAFLAGMAGAGVGRIAGLWTVLGRITRPWVGRGALLVGWMWLGWHLFAR